MSPPADRFTPASTQRTWLRAALFGPSGAGKNNPVRIGLAPEQGRWTHRDRSAAARE